MTAPGWAPPPPWAGDASNASVGAALDGSSQLLGSSTGGFLVSIVGENLGPWPQALGGDSVAVNPGAYALPVSAGAVPSVSCVLVSAWPVATFGAVPVCDGAETFLGEGEVSQASILSWNHTVIQASIGSLRRAVCIAPFRVVSSSQFFFPGGVGRRAVSVAVGGSSPTTPSPYGNWAYDAPVLASYAIKNPNMVPVSAGTTAVASYTVSTDGGTSIQLQASVSLAWVTLAGI